MKGRLNSFQKTMLQWNEMHPYNAVHVVQVPGVLNSQQLELSINATLERRGLSNLGLDREKNTYSYGGGPVNSQVKIIANQEDPTPALHAEIEQQLNTPFDHTRLFSPFRFFAAPATASFFLGLVYFHAMADAESVLLLLRDFLRVYSKKVGS